MPAICLFKLMIRQYVQLICSFHLMRDKMRAFMHVRPSACRIKKHIPYLVYIAGPHGYYYVSGAGVLLKIIYNLLKCLHVYTCLAGSGNGLGQIPGMDFPRVLFPCAVYISDDYLVNSCQCVDKILKQHFGAGIGMWLK